MRSGSGDWGFRSRGRGRSSSSVRGLKLIGDTGGCAAVGEDLELCRHLVDRREHELPRVQVWPDHVPTQAAHDLLVVLGARVQAAVLDGLREARLEGATQPLERDVPRLVVDGVEGLRNDAGPQAAALGLGLGLRSTLGFGLRASG